MTIKNKKMKKTLLIIGFLIFTINAIKAQNKVNFGVKGGINFTNMTTQNSGDKSGKTGIHIGLLAEFQLNDKVSIQPEILYSTQGAKTLIFVLLYPTSDVFQSNIANYKFNYIQIPVLAKIYLIKNLSLEIGPSFNFIVKNELVTNTFVITDVGNHFEFGGVLGASYKINKTIFLNSRYLRGFSNALNKENSSGDSKNFGFQIGVGFLL